MFERLARFLRKVASRLDGQTYINERWHQISIQSMNEYIGDTERYIIELENKIPSGMVAYLRSNHSRFDTRRLVNGGAWGGPRPEEMRRGSDPDMN